MIKVLELFAGSRSIGKAAEKLGCKVFSVDWQKFENIDLSIDIEFLQPNDIPFVPDFIHMSPDCTTYSVMALSKHRNGVIPKTEYAKKCDNVIIHCLELIKYYLSINPKLIYTIENPRGMLRKMPFMRGLERKTVWYCRYNYPIAKPTDIWTNNCRNIFNPTGWQPKQVCFNSNKNCHHIKCPRGSHKGIESISNKYERSKIPNLLCEEIIRAAINTLNYKL